jgi:hypothetical protein
MKTMIELEREKARSFVQRIFDKHRIKSPQARDEIALELARRILR